LFYFKIKNILIRVFTPSKAGEKALKSVWYLLEADPWGHSVKKLIQNLENVDLDIKRRLDDVLKSAVLLDRYYIPTRYPNGLPDLIPEEAFLEEDAKAGIENAGIITDAVKNILSTNIPSEN